LPSPEINPAEEDGVSKEAPSFYFGLSRQNEVSNKKKVKSND
jgi:hypothetical protein